MVLRIETTSEKWQKEYMTMISNGYYLVARGDKIFWELDEEND